MAFYHVSYTNSAVLTEDAYCAAFVQADSFDAAAQKLLTTLRARLGDHVRLDVHAVARVADEVLL